MEDLAQSISSADSIRGYKGQLFTVSAVLEGTSAATAANYGVIYTAPYACELIEAWETHKTAGTNGSAVTLSIEKLTSGTALDSGVAMIDSTFNLKGTADTPQRQKTTTILTNRVLSPSERVALKDAGTLTDVAHVEVTLLFRTMNYTLSSTA